MSNPFEVYRDASFTPTVGFEPTTLFEKFSAVFGGHMELVLAASLFAAGWIAGRFTRWSDEWIAIVGGVVLASGIAIERGVYLKVFDPYDRQVDLFGGLTANVLAGFALYLGAFLIGSIARRRWSGTTGPALGSVTARIEVFRSSEFAHIRHSQFANVVIVNGSNYSICLTQIALAGTGETEQIIVSSTSHGEVRGSVIVLNEVLRSQAQLSVRVETRQLPQLRAVWVHGVEIASMIAWHVEARPIERNS